MVTAEELAILDLLLWLRTGQEVADRLGCHQATVSRRAATCAAAFRLQLKRVAGDWQLRGPLLLLQMERRVHQLYRLRGGQPLRIETSDTRAGALVRPAPPGWITGRGDPVDPARTMPLLRERVIDAWLASDQPGLGPEDRELTVVDGARFQAGPAGAGLALVVHRDLVGERRIARLLELLRRRPPGLRAERPALELV